MLERMDCHGMTDIGRVRDENQDQFLIADLSKSMAVQQTSLGLEQKTRLFGDLQGKLLLVADGLGGHAAGERASSIAVDSVTNYVLNTLPWFFRLDAQGEDDLAEQLKAALAHCQSRIHAEAVARPQRAGMGTTVTLAYLLWPRLFVVHAGDSRCYLLRGSRLRQITNDQTVAQRFVDSGELRPEDVETSKWSHVLWNVVGGDSDELNSEVYKARLELGDTLLLCTDGLTKHLADNQIVELLEAERGSEAACRRMIDTANEAGGTDNITVIVARFAEVDGDEATPIISVEGATPSPDDTLPC